MTLSGYHHLAGNVFVAGAPTPQSAAPPAPAARPATDPAQVVIAAYCAARTDAVSGKGSAPGAARASMVRILAASGQKPAA